MSDRDAFDLDAAPRRRRRWPWVIVFVLVIGLVGTAATAGVYLWRLSTSYDKAETVPAAKVFPTVRPTQVNPEAMNILLLGSDTRGGLGGGWTASAGSAPTRCCSCICRLTGRACR